MYICIYTRVPSCKVHEDEATRKKYQKETTQRKFRFFKRNFLHFERNLMVDKTAGHTRMGQTEGKLIQIKYVVAPMGSTRQMDQVVTHDEA